MSLRKQSSLLDDLGEEITGIAWPVSVCMALTIFLVRLLNPDGQSSSFIVFIASAAYDENENPDAPMLEKLEGALLNALVFVGVMVVMTFVLVLLFKYGCYRAINVYMGFAVMDIFFLITGLLIILLCQRAGIHVDVFSFTYILFNFSVVGTLGVLFMPIPLLMKQGYMVWTGVIIAYLFTWIPDWTSWVLLVAMALYDIAAVLMPGGPLKMLVEIAIERQEALPALIYESRPARGYQGAGHWEDRRGTAGAGNGADAEQPPLSQRRQAGGADVGVIALEVQMEGGSTSVALPAAVQGRSKSTSRGEQRRGMARARSGAQPLLQQDAASEEEEEEDGGGEARPLLVAGTLSGSSIVGAAGPAGRLGAGLRGLSRPGSVAGSEVEMEPVNGEAAATPGSSPARVPADDNESKDGDDESAPLLQREEPAAQPQPRRRPDGVDVNDGDDDEGYMPDGIKLGLGDFIFYSMLVGKAAAYDMMTVFAAYIGIVAGLGITLLCLSVFKRALPALPFSIALGVGFYFLTRMVMEPFVVPFAMHFVWF